MKKKLYLLLAFISVVASLFGGGRKEAAGQPVINIAGDGATNPFQWTDEKGNMVGYDIDVSNEIARRAGLTLKWEKVEFPGLFLGLDSNKYQVIVNDLSKTEAREEKYLFSDNYYVRNATGIVTRKGRTDIKSIDDLVGKKVPRTPRGDAYSLFLEKYNNEHPNAQINLIVSEIQPTEQINGVATGQFDAVLTDLIIAQQVIKETGTEFTIVELPEIIQENVASTKAYFMFSKSSTELQKKWDAALETLIADGTLRELSLKYLGGDFSR